MALCKIGVILALTAMLLGSLVGVPSSWAQSATVPAAPTDLTATADETSIKLEWKAPTSDGGRPIIGYKIERASQNYPYSDATSSSYGPIVPDTGSPSTTYIDKTIRPLTGYSYRISAINAQGTGAASNPTSIIKFESMFGVWGIGYFKSSVADIAFDKSGNIDILQTNFCRAICKFDTNGVFVSAFGGLISQVEAHSQKPAIDVLVTPVAMAIDGSDNIYVVDQGLNRIQKYDSSLDFLESMGSLGTGDGQFKGPSDIAFDKSGNFYVVDSGNFRIQKFDPSGTFVSKFGSLGRADGQFTEPRAIAIDTSGNIFVSEDGYFTAYRIQKFDSSGTFVSKLEGHCTDQNCSEYTNAITFDSSDNLYVTENERGIQNFKISKYNSDFILLSTFGSPTCAYFDGQECREPTQQYFNSNSIPGFQCLCPVAVGADGSNNIFSFGPRIKKIAQDEFISATPSTPSTPTPPTTQQSTAAATLDGKSYSVVATGAAKVTSATINAKKSVMVSLSGSGEIQLKLPKNMIDGISTITAGGQNIPFTTVGTTASDTTIKFTVPSGTSSVEIQGAMVVPEFGVIAAIVLATSLLGVISIARLRGRSLGFRL